MKKQFYSVPEQPKRVGKRKQFNLDRLAGNFFADYLLSLTTDFRYLCLIQPPCSTWFQYPLSCCGQLAMILDVCSYFICTALVFGFKVKSRSSVKALKKHFEEQDLIFSRTTLILYQWTVITKNQKKHEFNRAKKKVTWVILFSLSESLLNGKYWTTQFNSTGLAIASVAAELRPIASCRPYCRPKAFKGTPVWPLWQRTILITIWLLKDQK